MSQHDMVVGNAGGAAVRADINAALAALVSQNSGTSAPSTTYPFMWWQDTSTNTSTNILKQRNADDDAWIPVASIDQANDLAQSDATYDRGRLFGLTLSNNVSDATNDIDIAAGYATEDANAWWTMLLASSLTKRLDAVWAVGTGNGGLDTGAIANGTYHVWLIRRPDTGVVDALFSTSASAPTMPTSYTQKRRIGSIIRASAAILGFVQDGDVFTLKSAIGDISATNPGTSAVTRTLTVPTGIRVRARGYAELSTTTTSSGFVVRISDLSATDDAAAEGSNFTTLLQTLATAGTYFSSGYFAEWTNTSAQVRSRMATSNAATALKMSTIGWDDPRGRMS